MVLKLTVDKCREYIKQKLFSPCFQNQVQSSTGLVGVELESIPLLKLNPSAEFQIPPFLNDEFSVANSLARMSEENGGRVLYRTGNHEKDHSHLDSVIFPNGSMFQFEPGGQTEITTKPCSSIAELKRDLAYCQTILDQLTKKDNIHFLQCGINQWFSAEEIGLQNTSDRYLSMARYFDKLGPYGKQMMLQTCSMHINIDLGEDLEIRSKRIMLSNLLVPFSSAIFSNSRMLCSNGDIFKSYRKHIWNQLDPSRTGVLYASSGTHLMDIDEMVDIYMEFALNAPVIITEAEYEKGLSYSIPFRDWLSNSSGNTIPEMSDFENHLSMLFPEIRLHGYIEIRNLDVPPRKWQLIPVMFYAGLLYHTHSLEKGLELLLPFTSSMNRLESESPFGLESDEIFETSIELMKMAIDAYDALPGSFTENTGVLGLRHYMEEYLGQRKSFADDEGMEYSF